MPSVIETAIRSTVTKGITAVASFNRGRMADAPNPFLNGINAPVDKEVSLQDLQVTGQIPTELNGRYLRIGPNPLGPVKAASHHWFVGDGMVQANIWSKLSFTAQAGRAYQIAADGYGATSSGNLVFHMSQSNAAPVLTSQPQSLWLDAGANATFAVTASGPALLYTWRFNGANLAISGSPTYTRTNAQAAHAGFYTVRVSNSAGAVDSAPAVLFVRQAPSFLAVPTTQVVDPGGSATFGGVATGTAPLTYQWSYQGVPLPGALGTNYSLTNVQYGDGGVYTLLVTNGTGSATAGAELIVRPLFTSVTPSNGTLTLRWSGTTGKVYIVEGTTNLTPPATAWTTLGSVTNTALPAQFPLPMTNTTRALRLRVGP